MSGVPRRAFALLCGAMKGDSELCSELRRVGDDLYLKRAISGEVVRDVQK